MVPYPLKLVVNLYGVFVPHFSLKSCPLGTQEHARDTPINQCRARSNGEKKDLEGERRMNDNYLHY